MIFRMNMKAFYTIRIRSSIWWKCFEIEFSLFFLCRSYFLGISQIEIKYVCMWYHYASNDSLTLIFNPSLLLTSCSVPIRVMLCPINANTLNVNEVPNEEIKMNYRIENNVTRRGENKTFELRIKSCDWHFVWSQRYS